MTVKIACCRCRMDFWVTDAFNATLRQTEQTFFCPAGHPQHFPLGESETDKLRRERDRLKQDQAWYEDRLRAEKASRELADRRAAAARGQVTKLKKRAAAGVCPCCNRTFTDLHRHMNTKHPGFIAEPDAADHVQH